MDSPARPTPVRYVVIALITVVAVLLYVDRYCFNFVKPYVQGDLSLTDDQTELLVGSFFFAYAFGQIPGGWLSDRFGARTMLTFYLASWSVLTALMGFAPGFTALLLLRVGCGLFEAGAYPACAGLIRRWVPYRQRGQASGAVSIGGRLGGALYPVLTAYLLVALAALSPEPWRPIFWLYGAAGVLLAVPFGWDLRDNPRRHPGCNAAEVALIEEEATPAAPAAPAGRLWLGILTSRGLWLSSFVQFGTNFGWLFLANLLPEYLLRVHDVPVEERGWMASLPFLVSLPMLLVGGWWTDWLTRRYGRRLGRCLPLALTRFAAAAAFLACLVLDAPWPVTLAACVVSVASDAGLPAIWAYCLDVGGPNVGLVLGWGNMWGNLGAAASPSALLWVRREYGWDGVFIACAAVYVVIGLASLGIDATRPVVAEA